MRQQGWQKGLESGTIRREALAAACSYLEKIQAVTELYNFPTEKFIHGKRE